MTLTTSDWVGIAGAVIGLIGIPITWILARRGRQRPDLRYALRFDEVITPADRLSRDGLVLSFGGEQIGRLNKTVLAIWNKRGDTVRGEDVVTTNPLRVQLAEGDRMLQARVIGTTRDANACSVSIDAPRTAALVTFDFLDASDGMVIEVLHQGRKPVVDGVLRGASLRRQAQEWNVPAAPATKANLFRRAFRSVGYQAFVAAYAAAMGIVGILYLATMRQGAMEPNSEDFDLHSLDGKLAFAKAMNSFQSVFLDPTVAILFTAMSLFFLVYAGWQFREIWKRRFAVPVTFTRMAGKADKSEQPRPDDGDIHLQAAVEE